MKVGHSSIIWEQCDEDDHDHAGDDHDHKDHEDDHDHDDHEDDHDHEDEDHEDDHDHAGDVETVAQENNDTPEPLTQG